MKYERLTTRNNFLGIVINRKVITLQGLLERLFDLEDKIERGELISTVQDEQSEQEIAFFVKHNAEVRKQAVREFLKLLKEKESPKLLMWEYGEGYLDCIKTAEELAAQYGVEVEE